MHTHTHTNSAGTVVDTAGALCIVDGYTWLQPHWRRVQQLEQSVFAIVLLALGHSSSAVLQLVGAAVVLCAFNWYAAVAQPFLHPKEAELDGTLSARHGHAAASAQSFRGWWCRRSTV
eukprot:6034-Heterococcus_DN1.PRE.2